MKGQYGLYGTYKMSKELAEYLGKSPDSLHQTIRENMKYLLESIPTKEILEIFEEEEEP